MTLGKLSTFEYKDIKVVTFYNGTTKVPNETYINNELVYSDNTYRPSPLYDMDGEEVMVALLGFLILTKSDVDDEFFEDRDNPKLLDWAENSDTAEEIRLMINDFEMCDDDEWLEDNEMSYDEARKITNYIS